MTRINRMISIEPYVNDKCNTQQINVSSLCNDFLDKYTSTTTQDLSAVDYMIKKKEKEALQQTLIQTQSDLSLIDKDLIIIEQSQKEKEINDLRQEAERIQLEKKCNVCGVPIENKLNEVLIKENVFIHKGCYNTLSPEKYRELIQL